MRTLFPLGIVALVLLAIPGVVVFAADLFGYGPDINLWLEGKFGVSHRVALGLPAAMVMFAIPPLIILLYFLRLKRKPVAVPSTFLWKKSVEDLHVNRLMQWIRRNVLLLLQLLAVLAMIYGVLGPRLHGSIGGGRYYILIIDNSASMSAKDLSPDRLSWAKAEAIKEIDATTDSDFGMVIVFNDVAEIRQGYTANRVELRSAVQAIKPTNRPTKLDEALSLAASLANPDRSTMNESVRPENPEPGKERTYVGIDGFQADVHLYSDGRFPDVPDFALANLNLNWHVPPIPEEAGANNVAILEFNAERAPDDPTTILARAFVRNYSNQQSSARPRVELLANGNQLLGVYDDDDTKKNKKWEPIPAKTERSSINFTIPDITENSDLVLRLKLDEVKDAFPLDDQAWVVFGIIRKSRVLIVGPENKLLRNFFDTPSVKKLADVTYFREEVLKPEADPKDYRTPAREGKFDLVIFDRCGPTTEDDMPAANTFFIGYPPMPFLPANSMGDAKKKVKLTEAGPSVRGWDSKHPVMRNLQSLDEIDISEAFGFPDLPPRTQRLIEGSENLVLLSAMPRTPYTDLALAFPILTNEGKWNTNWPLKVSFPLFMRNMLQTLGNVRDAGTEEPVKPGQVKHLRIGGSKELRLTKPDGALEVMQRGPRADFGIADTDQLGVYVARWDDLAGKGVQTRRFAVNLFDRMESDLSLVKEVSVGSQKIEAGKPRKAPQDLWKWPLLVGLFVLMTEWWVYNKRVQI
jgi:hypothetical protein